MWWYLYHKSCLSTWWDSELQWIGALRGLVCWRRPLCSSGVYPTQIHFRDQWNIWLFFSLHFLCFYWWFASNMSCVIAPTLQCLASLASGQFNRGQSPTWAFSLFMIMNDQGPHVASCCPIHHLAKGALNQLKGNSKWPKVASTEPMIHSCHCATMNWGTILFYTKMSRKTILD